MKKNMKQLKDNPNFKKRVEENLKGGSGYITIYTALIPHEELDVYEWGYIIMPIGSCIGLHEHSDDNETWEIKDGWIVYYYDNEKEEVFRGERTCFLRHSHGAVNIGEKDAVIYYEKIK